MSDRTHDLHDDGDEPAAPVTALLSGFRADEAELDELTRSRIRARAMASITASSSAPTAPAGQASASLAPAGQAPAGQLADPEPIGAAARIELIPDAGRGAGGNAGVDAPADDVGAARRRRRRWLTVLDVAAVLLVVALVGGVLLRRGDDQVAAGPGIISRDELVAAAKASAEQRLTGDAQLHRRVVHAEQRSVDGGDPVVVMRSTESWVAADGSGREELSAESLLDPGSASERSLAPKGRFIGAAGELDLGSLSYMQVRGLPADSGALLREIETRVRASRPDDEAVASMLASVLSLDVTPPTVRAAAVDALFQIGATTVGTVRGPDGRPGEGVMGATSTGERWMVVLDPQRVRTIAFVSGFDDDPVDADLTRASSWTSYAPSEIIPPTN